MKLTPQERAEAWSEVETALSHYAASTRMFWPTEHSVVMHRARNMVRRLKRAAEKRVRKEASILEGIADDK